MVAKFSLPPAHHHPHLTTTLPPSAALEHLSKFLLRTQTKPYLHPDSLLSRDGITYPPKSGPSGGLAINHLKRIERGLKGEHVIDELAMDEGDEWDDQQNGEFDASGQRLPASDDRRLDAQIRHADDKERTGGLGKRKRTRDDIASWAETSSQAGAPPEEEDGTTTLAGTAYGQEVESFANTPLHVSDWQDQEEYELQQSPVEGEVGDRDGAPVVRQNGKVPDVEEHDDQGRVKKRERKGEKESGGGKTEAQKEARREAKKAKKKAGRAEKAKEAQGKG